MRSAATVAGWSEPTTSEAVDCDDPSQSVERLRGRPGPHVFQIFVLVATAIAAFLSALASGVRVSQRRATALSAVFADPRSRAESVSPSLLLAVVLLAEAPRETDTYLG